MMDEFKCVRQREDGEEGIWCIPDAMLKELLSCSEDRLWKASQAWANTEELQWEALETKMILDDLVKLARRAQ